MTYQCTNKVMLAFLGIALLIWHSHSACAEEKSLTNDVRNVLLRGVVPTENPIRLGRSPGITKCRFFSQFAVPVRGPSWLDLE